MHKDYERDNETCQSRAKQDVNDVRSSFCFCTADLIFHMCLESVTHNDNVENLLFPKVINQAGGRGRGNCTESDDARQKGFNNHTLRQEIKTFMAILSK